MHRQYFFSCCFFPLDRCYIHEHTVCLLKSTSSNTNTKSCMYITVRIYVCASVCRGSVSVDQLGTSVCVCICVSGSPWRCLPGAVTSPWLTALISKEAGCKFCQCTSHSTCVCVYARQPVNAANVRHTYPVGLVSVWEGERERGS